MEVQRFSDRLELHTALTRATTQWPVDPKRVLVLFFPWLGAKKKHIQSYCDLYRSTGLDVLVVNSANSDFLWPPNSFKLAKQTTEVITTCFKLCWLLFKGRRNNEINTINCMHVHLYKKNNVHKKCIENWWFQKCIEYTF